MAWERRRYVSGGGGFVITAVILASVPGERNLLRGPPLTAAVRLRDAQVSAVLTVLEGPGLRFTDFTGWKASPLVGSENRPAFGHLRKP